MLLTPSEYLLRMSFGSRNRQMQLQPTRFPPQAYNQVPQQQQGPTMSQGGPVYADAPQARGVRTAWVSTKHQFEKNPATGEIDSDALCLDCGCPYDHLRKCPTIYPVINTDVTVVKKPRHRMPEGGLDPRDVARRLRVEGIADTDVEPTETQKPSALVGG
jgi:hypothetical protein